MPLHRMQFTWREPPEVTSDVKSESCETILIKQSAAAHPAVSKG